MVGNTSNYTKIDILRCFLRIDKATGRKELAKELGMGEGTVRTMLDLLKSHKLLDSTKHGHFLSKKGSTALSEIYGCISQPKIIKGWELYPEYIKSGIVIKNASAIKSPYKLRDMAVKTGSEGAVILKFDDKLYAPESEYDADYSGLERHFDLKKNDVLAVACSGEKSKAEEGALAIAVELSVTLKRFISQF